MRLGITQRLFLTITAAALLSVVSLVLIMQWSLDRGFLRYVNNQERAGLTRLAGLLEERYAAAGSWDFVRRDPLVWQQLLAESLPETGDRPHRHGRGWGEAFPDAPPPSDGRPGNGPPPGRGPEQRFFLLDAARQPLVAPRNRSAAAELTPLRQGEAVVGYLGLLPHRVPVDERQRRFLREQKTAFLLVGGVILLLAGGLSLPLSLRLLRPLRTLARATDSLAAGNYDTRVPVTSADELGQLARDFNALALSLEKTEQARREWVADISHELRTPLAVLRGEIEALQDGVRPPTAASFASLHGEVLRLGRLVDDLYQLSLADVGALSYRKEELDLWQLLEELVDHYRQDFVARGLTLELATAPAARLAVHGDPVRLRQLFANLLDNSLKYTDPGGRAVLSLQSTPSRVTATLDDSAPTVDPRDMERLFERLYRVETSRNRATGGAGLGLAICRTIAAAHEGEIIAAPSPLGGVRMSVTLPRWGGR